MIIENNDISDECPLCSSKKINSLGDVNYNSETFFSTEKISLKRVPSLSICLDCKSKFIQNRIPEKLVYDLYAKSSSNKRWGNEASFEQIKNKEIVNTLTKLFARSKFVVDVGCNTGLLLDLAKKNNSNTIGVELSEDSKKILLSKGHEVCESLEELDDESVDLITAFDLVEHLYNVNDFFKICNKKLVKGGGLVILTGNPSSISASLSGKNWWYIKYPEHIVFPSKAYYRALKNFSMCKYVKTYASKGYKSPMSIIFIFLIKSFIKKIFFSFEYTGLPSFGPDHHLIVLRK